MFFPALTPSSLAGLNTARASSTRVGLVPPEVPGSPAAFPRERGVPETGLGSMEVPVLAACSVLQLAGGACRGQPGSSVGAVSGGAEGRCVHD